MILFELTYPVLTFGQESKILEEHPEIDQQTLHRFDSYACGIFTEDYEEYKKDQIVSLSDMKDEWVYDTSVPFKYGADGSKYWLSIQGIEDVLPLYSIYIPEQVFEVCEVYEWHGISMHAARLCRRNTRLLRLVDLGCPLIILSNEMHQIRQLVEILECNPDFGGNRERVKYNDGTLVTSLRDVGYSLTEGWSNERLAQFAEEERQIQEEIDRQAEETSQIFS